MKKVAAALLILFVMASAPLWAAASLVVTSAAFQDGQPIPKDCTADGKDESPALGWHGLPEGTKSLAILCEDPDAPAPSPFCHWLLYNVSPDLTHLPPALPHTSAILGSGCQATNDFGHIGYNGPAPPPGKVHHYIFTVYALEERLAPDSIHDRSALLAAMRGKILASGHVTATWKR